MLKKIIMIILTALLFLGCDNEIHGQEKKSSMQTEPEGKTTDKANNKTRQQVQNLNYTDSEQIIYNPDMGFYSVITLTVTKNGIEDKKLEEIASHNPICIDGVYPDNDEEIWPASFDQLLLEFDISSFSTRNEGGVEKENGKPLHLPSDDIGEVLEAVKRAGKTAIVRFAYDPEFGGDGENRDVEPEDFELIFTHIEDISSVLKDYTKILTALQCGMIGPWGEMNFTTYSKSVDKNQFEKLVSKYDLDLTSVPDDGNKIEHGFILLVMRKFIKELEANNCNIPFLVRQPRFIYDYLKRRDNAFAFDGVNPPEVFVPTADKIELYRLGLYNDGYLGSADDSGTYTLANRSAEVTFVQEFTNHTPFGGELIGDFGIKMNNFSSFEEMFKVHLSYLNIAWNPSFFRQFNSLIYNGETAFQYLIKHMGYRYILTKSVFETSDDGGPLEIRLSFENKGFANIPYHRKKILILYFVKDGNLKLTKTLPNMVFDGNSKEINIDTGFLASGTYTVYLKVSDEDGAYPIRFANDLWEPELMANKIGQFTK